MDAAPAYDALPGDVVCVAEGHLTWRPRVLVALGLGQRDAIWRARALDDRHTLPHAMLSLVRRVVITQKVIGLICLSVPM